MTNKSKFENPLVMFLLYNTTKLLKKNIKHLDNSLSSAVLDVVQRAVIKDIKLLINQIP